MEEQFYKYEKVEKTIKVLFIYLLLNDCAGEKDIDHLEEEEETLMFGIKLKKVYGYSTRYVDVNKIVSEIASIQTPIVCSPMSYEYFSESPNIYVYTPKKTDEGERFLINDMDIISNVMVITENQIISSNKVSLFIDSDRAVSGFENFKDYVLRGETKVGDWNIRYSLADRLFEVFYGPDLLYSAVELDKTSTYKLVIYIIRKVKRDADNVLADCFECAEYVRKEEQ
jgi:hypothetical protein